MGETKAGIRSLRNGKEARPMLIFMFAAAMMLSMLIATAVALHQEAQHVKLENRIRPNRYRIRR